MEQQYMNLTNTTAEIEISKSRFIASIQRTASEELAKDFIGTIKSKYPDANHHCSAYIIGKNALIQRAHDDGEPSGTAGVPMLEVLKREGLYNVTVVVTRYFGGTKLGGGGLIRSYSKSTSTVTKKAGTVQVFKKHPLRITIDYTHTNTFEHFLTNEGLSIDEVTYMENVTYRMHVTKSELSTVLSKLEAITRDHFSAIVDDVVDTEAVVTPAL